MNAAESDGRLSVVVIGGAGAMGRYAVRTAAKLGSARRLVIADRNIEAARRLAAEIGEPCEAVEVDASDDASLARTFEGHDAVLNTTGPFARFATPILRAAIEVGCDYIDIDDDWQPTVEALELDGKARENGCTVVVGLGSSPGVSNLCALVAARRLDQVDEIITGWKLSAAVAEEEPDYPAGPAGAALQHWLLQASDEIRIWGHDGPESARPVQNVEFEFPGVGTVKAYTIGHPEPVTLPRYIPGLTRSVNVMTGPDWVFEYLQKVAAEYSDGKLTLEAGAAALEHPPRPEGGRRSATPLPICWSLARGMRGGKHTAVAVYPQRWPKGKMGGNTGIPLAIGLELLRQGEIAEPGVHAPEGAVDPELFFDLMAQFIDPPAASGEEMLAVDEHAVG
jgi:saccharopine dehydrogenase-like NADP-dependent oxidoreductase